MEMEAKRPLVADAAFTGKRYSTSLLDLVWDPTVATCFSVAMLTWYVGGGVTLYCWAFVSLDNGSIYGDGDDVSIAIVENAKSRIRVQKRGIEHEEQGNSSSWVQSAGDIENKRSNMKMQKGRFVAAQSVESSIELSMWEVNDNSNDMFGTTDEQYRQHNQGGKCHRPVTYA